MTTAAPRPDDTNRAPQHYRDALAELVRVGVTMARMLETVARVETAAAEAALQPRPAAEFPPPAGSLAEAIEADAAMAAAAEARQTIVARAQSVTAAFGSLSRSLRLTVLLGERLDRGWARRSVADDRRAMARRQIARAVGELIGLEADGDRAHHLTEALADRLERLDTESGIGDRPAEDIIREICRDLGLDPARLTALEPLPGDGGPAVPGSPEPGRTAWQPHPPRHPPDG